MVCGFLFGFKGFGGFSGFRRLMGGFTSVAGFAGSRVFEAFGRNVKNHFVDLVFEPKTALALTSKTRDGFRFCASQKCSLRLLGQPHTTHWKTKTLLH